MKNRRFKKLLSAILITSFVAPVYGILIANKVSAQIGGNEPKSLAEALKEYEQKCEEQANPFGDLSNITGSIQEKISNGIQDKISESLNKVLTEKIPEILQDKLENELPQKVEELLSEQLPGIMEGKINGLRGQGYDDEEIYSRMPGLLEESTNDLLPKVLQQALQQLIRQALESGLLSGLAEEFKNILPGIIQGSGLPGDVSSIVASTTDALVAIPNPAADIWNQLDIFGILPDLPPDVSFYMRDFMPGGAAEEVINNILSLLTEAIINGITHGEGIQQLVDDLVPAISGHYGGGLNDGLFGNFSNISDNIGFESVSSGFSFDEFQDWAGNDIFESAGFGGMTDGIAEALGEGARSGIRDWQVGGMIDGLGPSFTEAELVDGLQDIPGGLDSVGYIGDDGHLVFHSSDQIGNDAGAAVEGASGQIGERAVGGMDWGAIGNSFKGAFASGIGSGLGGLVSDIPFIGGPLSQIVEQVITQSLEQLMGVVDPTAAISVLTSDTGTHLGLSNANKHLAAIEDLTEKKWDRDFEMQEEHRMLISESCLRLQMIIGRLQTLNELEYIHKPNNLKKGMAQLAARQAELAVTEAEGYRAPESSTGVAGENGEPLYAPNWGQRVQDAVSNAFGSAIDTIKSLGDQAPLAKKAADTLIQEQAATQNLANQLGPNAEWQERGAAFIAGNSDDPSRDLVTLLDPWASNNWATAFTNANKFIDSELNEAAQNRREELIAGQGMLGITICLEWTADGKHCKYEQTIIDPSKIRAMSEAYNQAWIDAMSSGVFNAEMYALELARINARFGGEQVASMMEGRDPCPSDGAPCDETGWNPGAAEPRDNYYPGQEALSNSSSQSDWRTKLNDSITEGFSDFFDTQLNNFMQEGEDVFDHLTDFEDFTRTLNGSGRPSEFERISSAAFFANSYVDQHQASFAANADLDELIEIIFNYILGLMESALTQND